MADTDVPQLPDNSSLSTTNDLTRKTSQAFEGLQGAISGAKNTLGDLYSKLNTINQSMQANGELTRDQTTAFSALSVALLGTRKAFEGLSDIDTRGLNTFTQQITDLQQVILKDSSIGSLTAATAAMAANMVKAGIPIKDVVNAMKGGFEGVASFAMQIAQSADNALKLQNAVVQLASKTGELGDVYSAAGTNLNNINEILQLQQKALTDTATATQLPIDAIEKYYAELGSVPRALKENITSSSNASQSVSMLTATIQYATGSGRKYSEVIDDLKTAFRDYNLTGEDALKFTARMGELSNKFGVELSDVRDSLRATADAFKIFGNEGEGAAAIMNDYLGALEKTGLSGRSSIEIIKGLTDGIKGMGLAQKAFLSAQTGGPGGLMGAFQIEKELREGKIDKVFAQVRQQMQRQFGQIVTLDEAAQSPQAAAQLTKQIAILRQGPLGQFAKDDQSAIRLLEGFKNKDTGKVTSEALSGTILKDTMGAGVDLQKKSVTELSRIRAILEATRGAAAIGNLSATQQGFTAGTGLNPEGADTGAALRDDLSQVMSQGGAASGRTTATYAKGLQTKILQDQSGVISKQIIDEYLQFASEVDDAIKAPLEMGKQTLKGLQTGLPGGITGPDTDEANYFNAGNQLGGVTQSSIANAAKTPRAAGATSGTATPTAAGSGADKQLGELTVHIEGYCIDCGEKIKGSSQSYAVNIGQRARK